MNGLRFVFCEGGDDVAVANGLAASVGLNDLHVEPFNGKDNLRNFLKAVRLRPEFTRNEVAAIGIIRDADNDADTAFRSVCDVLAANGFNAPNVNGGFAEGDIKTGVLIVGPAEGRGMIEDLCLDSVSDRPEFPCVDEYFRCIAERSGRTGFTSKAKVRVWVASQVDYEFHVGKAVEKGYWPWESPVFEPLKQFLREL